MNNEKDLMAGFGETFDMFFSEWTEERAAEYLTNLAQTKQSVDAALAGDDWKALARLGYCVRRYDGDGDDMYQSQSSVAFDQKQYDDMVADLKLTPKQLADRMNQ